MTRLTLASIPLLLISVMISFISARNALSVSVRPPGDGIGIRIGIPDDQHSVVAASHAPSDPAGRQPPPTPPSPDPTPEPPLPLLPTQPPTTRTDNCTQGQCHAAMLAPRHLHAPVAVGACDMCHTYADVAAHTFRIEREGVAMCDFCHIGRRSGQVVHEPVAQGRCLDCHDPHGSAVRTMVKKPTVGELCLSCHEDVTSGRASVHPPAAQRDCTACHNGHFSSFPKLLIYQGRDLCLECHEQLQHELETQGFIHEPVTDDCLECHDPHASDHPAQLRQKPKTLCMSCHDNIARIVAEAAIPHSIVADDQRACLNCHAPHTGRAGTALMREAPLVVCLTCHDQPIETDDGKTVADMSYMAQPGQYLHGPARDGNCKGCHEVHGSNLPDLLPYPYAVEFYQQFQPVKYALCFSCHDASLVTHQRTEDATGFRNGPVNLHHLHVNPTDEVGRNCRACHLTHASDKPLHLRHSVPYGQWDLPIALKTTDTGGECAAGCHRAAKYDRLNPVEQEWLKDR